MPQSNLLQLDQDSSPWASSPPCLPGRMQRKAGASTHSEQARKLSFASLILMPPVWSTFLFDLPGALVLKRDALPGYDSPQAASAARPSHEAGTPPTKQPDRKQTRLNSRH